VVPRYAKSIESKLTFLYVDYHRPPGATVMVRWSQLVKHFTYSHDHRRFLP
jgi:hypothetical protein